MLFYIFIFIIISLLLFFKAENRNTNVIISIAILILLYGLRNQGGTDDLGYIGDFNNIISDYPVFGTEKTFIIVSKLMGSLGFNYKSVFMLYAIVSFCFLYFAYKELCNTRREWLIAICGFFVFSFLPTITLMRQFAASSIITYALVLKLKGYRKKPILFILIASLLHFAAISTIIILPFISFKHIKKVVKIGVPIMCLIIGYFGYFNIFLNSFNFIIPTKYLTYLVNQKTLPIGIVHLILFSIYIIQNIIPTLLGIKEHKNFKIEFLERMQFIYFSLYFITLSSGWINRMSIYFILFLPFIFITFSHRFTNNDKNIIFNVCYITFFILYIYILSGIPDNLSYVNLIPYDGSFNFIKID